MSKKHKKVCTTLNYIEHFFILVSSITECISISTFASLVGILTGITSSAVVLKVYAITAGIKKYKSIIKIKKKKRDKIVLLAKSKLNKIEVLISKAWFTSSVCGPFTKDKERIKKFKQTGDSQYIYQNELKLVFNMTWLREILKI